MKPHAPKFASENLDAPGVPESLILPSQWQDLSRAITHTPELRLMRAVLDDALYCLMSYSGSSHTRARRLFTEAEEWLMSNEQHWLYSFVSICRYLDLDENYVRRGICNWLEQHAGETERRWDHTSQKKTHTHSTRGRPALHDEVAWQQKIRGCEQWRVYLRTPEGRICELSSHGSNTEANLAVKRAKNNWRKAFAQTLAKKEAEIAAA